MTGRQERGQGSAVPVSLADRRGVSGPLYHRQTGEGSGVCGPLYDWQTEEGSGVSRPCITGRQERGQWSPV